MEAWFTRYWDNCHVTDNQSKVSQSKGTQSNLIITGGINHDFEDASEALSEVLAQAGFTSRICQNIDEGLTALSNEKFDLVTLYTLRWRMLDDDKYIPFREQWAYEIGEADRQHLLNHVARGGGLLGLHTTAICFDTWPEFFDLLGARWQWGTTYHPPPANFAVTELNQSHPASQGISDFEIVDEIYHHLASRPGAEPLFAAKSAEDKAMHTLAWANHYGKGRVIYDALGHDRASIKASGHAQFLQQAAHWLADDVG